MKTAKSEFSATQNGRDRADGGRAQWALGRAMEGRMEQELLYRGIYFPKYHP